MKEYSVKEKLRLVRRLIDGETCTSIVKDVGVEWDILHLWQWRYERYGEYGLEHLSGQTRYPEEKK